MGQPAVDGSRRAAPPWLAVLAALVVAVLMGEWVEAGTAEPHRPALSVAAAEFIPDRVLVGLHVGVTAQEAEAAVSPVGGSVERVVGAGTHAVSRQKKGRRP